MMKGWRTFFLLLLVLGLGGYIYFHEQFQADTATRQDNQRRAFAVDVDRASMLGIRTASYEIELRRDGEDWSLTGLTGARVQDAMVRQLLSRLRGLTRGDLISPSDMRDRGQTLADFGLAVPVAVLRIEDHMGMREYRIGNPNPLQTAIYVKEEGTQNVMMISTDLLEILPEDADDLRDRRLVHFQPSQIREIYVSHAVSGRIRFAREAGEWRFVEPSNTPADPERVDEWLHKLIQARIETFVSQDAGTPSDFGFDAPVAEIRFRGATGSVELQLGASVQDQPGLRYGRFAGYPWIFKVSEGVNVLASTPSAQLRDPRLMTTEVEKIQRVEILGAEDARMVFVKDQDTWRMRKPYEREAARQHVQGVLEVWKAASIVAYAELPETEAPRYTIRLFTTANGNGNSVLDVSVYAAEIPDVSRVLQAGRSEMFFVVPEVLDALPLDPLAYLSKQIFSFDPDQVIRVSQRLGETTWVYHVNEQQQWRVDDETAALDQEGLRDLIDHASGLQAHDLVSMGPPEGMATLLATSPKRISFGLQDDPRASLTLLLWRDPVSNEHLAMVQGRELYFQLSPDTLRQLQTPMILQDAHDHDEESAPEPAN